MFWLGFLAGFVFCFGCIAIWCWVEAAKREDARRARLCSGQPITRAEALARSRQTILRAEQERFLVPELDEA